MKKFKYGIMVLNPNLESIEGDGYVPVVHFVGYWSEPQPSDIEELIKEIETDESLGLTDIADELEYALAPADVVEHFNNVCEEDGVFDDESLDEPDINLINLN